MSTAGLIALLGVESALPVAQFYNTLSGFASEGEKAVYWALVELIGKDNFIYQGTFGDLAFTPGKDNRSADFLIPALTVAIMVNDPFTHPDPREDATVAFWFGLLGYRTYTVWTDELVPPTGNARDALLRTIPGLAIFGQTANRQDRLTKRYRKYGHGAGFSAWRPLDIPPPEPPENPFAPQIRNPREGVEPH